MGKHTKKRVYAIATCIVCGSDYQRTGSRHLVCSPQCYIISHSTKREDGCWVFNSALDNPDGTFTTWADFGGKRCAASRFSFEVFHRPLVEDEDVCHSCDRRTCVNPDHLFAGSHTENMHDMILKGRAVHPKGEDTHTAVLTERQVRAILAAEGKHKLIASKFGVSVPTVHDIKNGYTWTHVTGLPNRRKYKSAIHTAAFS